MRYTETTVQRALNIVYMLHHAIVQAPSEYFDVLFMGKAAVEDKQATVGLWSKQLDALLLIYPAVKQDSRFQAAFQAYQEASRRSHELLNMMRPIGEAKLGACKLLNQYTAENIKLLEELHPQAVC